MWLNSVMRFTFVVLLAWVACIACASSARTTSTARAVFDCPDCRHEQRASPLLLRRGDERYAIDLEGRSVRKFLVYRALVWAAGEDPEERAADAAGPIMRAWLDPARFTEVDVDPVMRKLYEDFQDLHDENPAYFQNVETRVPMGHPNLGHNPNREQPFDAFDLWYFGSTNQEWNGFVRRLERVLASESLTRQVLGDVAATAIFRVFRRLDRLGMEIVRDDANPGGSSPAWRMVSFCHAGYCLEVGIKPDRTFEFLGAYDEVDNAVPQLFGSEWSGSYVLPMAGPALDRIQNRFRQRDVEVTGDSCSGKVTLICAYPDGLLRSCHTQARCD